MTEKQIFESSGRPRRMLSIVMTGRDDDYMPDFLYRITTTINHIARNLQRLRRLDDVEIVIVDWGSEVPLAQTLALSDQAGQVCRFVYVPSEIVKTVQNGKNSFHSSKAPNAGFRRANADFVLLSGADTLIPLLALESILRLLKGEFDLPTPVDQAFFLCSRVHAPWQFVEGKPNLDAWDRFILMTPVPIPHNEYSSSFFIGAGAGGLMMHAGLWHKFKGLDEKIGGWGGNDGELMTRVCQYHPWISLVSLGVIFYHMEHSPFGRRGNDDSLAEKPELAFRVSPTLCVNDESWGLNNYDLPEQKAQYRQSPLETRQIEPTEETSYSRCSLTNRIISELTGDLVKHDSEKILLMSALHHIDLTPQEVGAIYFISWYSFYHYPLRYLEVMDEHRTFTTAAATKGRKITELYAIDNFEGSSVGVGAYWIEHLLRSTNYCGYGRYLNGARNTFLERLKKSFMADLSLDLVMVAGDVLGPDPVHHLKELIQHLTSGGALVYTRSANDRFREDWDAIQRLLPDLMYFECSGAPVGMILNSTVPNSESELFPATSHSIIVDLRPLRMNLRHLLWRRTFRRLVSRLTSFRNYPRYLKGILRMIKED